MLHVSAANNERLLAAQGAVRSARKAFLDAQDRLKEVRNEIAADPTTTVSLGREVT